MKKLYMKTDTSNKSFNMLTYCLYIFYLSLIVKAIDGCPERCTCSPDLPIVDCSNRDIRNPPKSYPEDTHTVNLNQNKITVLGPRSFQRQSTIEIMKISGNNIRVIRAYAFRPFSNLLTLDLSNNQIVKIYGRGLKGMNKVRTLSLSNNRIRSVTRIFMSTPNVFQLNLGFNKLRKLGEGDFATNIELHYLDLRNNQISSIHRNTFKNLRKLRTLFLNNNPLVNIPSQFVFGSEVLQLLDFSSCQLTTIPKGLPSSTEDLRFGHNQLTRINQSDLANATGLKMITFNENQIKRFEYFALGNALNLQEVWLRSNKLVYIPRGFPDSVKKVHMHSNMVHQIEGNLFSENSQLEYLDVSSNHVSNISSEAFNGLMKLEILNFEGNQIYDLKPGTFTDLVTLKSLLLGNNPIETIQAGAFNNLPNLTTLTMNYNPHEDVHINENFLLQMPNLETINLMASIGTTKSVLSFIENSNFVNENIKQIILTYNNIRKLSPSIRDTFPNIKKLSLDENAWICDHELLWLKQWMTSAIPEITFHEYSPPKCELPYGLTGSDIVDVRDSDFERHEENLLNDFPYWIVEEEFMKKESEEEKHHRLEKEKISSWEKIDNEKAKIFSSSEADGNRKPKSNQPDTDVQNSEKKYNKERINKDNAKNIKKDIDVQTPMKPPHIQPAETKKQLKLIPLKNSETVPTNNKFDPIGDQNQKKTKPHEKAKWTKNDHKKIPQKKPVFVDKTKMNNDFKMDAKLPDYKADGNKEIPGKTINYQKLKSQKMETKVDSKEDDMKSKLESRIKNKGKHDTMDDFTNKKQRENEGRHIKKNQNTDSKNGLKAKDDLIAIKKPTDKYSVHNKESQYINQKQTAKDSRPIKESQWINQKPTEKDETNMSHKKTSKNQMRTKEKTHKIKSKKDKERPKKEKYLISDTIDNEKTGNSPEYDPKPLKTRGRKRRQNKHKGKRRKCERNGKKCRKSKRKKGKRS